MILRCKYSKLGEIAFISHLDLLRIFIRALRRENIKLNYSQGFHPHPKLSFSPALSLGVESICEFVDVDIADEISEGDFQKRLNFALPNGVKITETKQTEKMGGITTLSTHSEYEIELENFDENIFEIAEKILNAEQIFIQKKNKKGSLLEVNVRDRIAGIKILEDKIYAILLNSVNGAMKPYEFVEIINKFSKKEYVPYKITKVGLYFQDGKDLSFVG